ncbi:MAG TPA: tetratricopeptide repeat protein [Opitutaceae bacterium]|nr:tetratricopeptide repeat protein [Opitutaceae bacterium]
MARRREFPVSPQPGSRSGRWLGLALLGLTVLAYLPALSCGFIWDDDAHLTQNPCIVGPLGFADIWTSAYARICPLVQSTFWLEYRLWGLEPMPYHLVTILMHAAASVVLWRVLRLLHVPGAWLGAALWALHPVQVESVAWITEMKNTQSGLFFLLAVLFFCRSRLAEAANTPAARARRDYILTLVFAAMALASKSSTVVLPLVLGLCGWWIDRGWRWRRNLLELTPLLVLSLAAGIVTLWTQQAEGAFDPEFARGFAERVASAGKVFWFYAGKLAWPDPLIFIYPRWRIDPATATAWLPAIAAAALLLGLWWQRERWTRGAFFAAAYFVIALGPVLGLVDTYFWRYSFVGDHFQYLASMGPLALAGAGLRAGFDALRSPPRWLLHAAGALILMTLGILTWRQCAMYRNDEILWTTTLRMNPASWSAHNNLAVELARQPGRSAEAIAHYEEALRLRPHHAQAHYNLAKEFAKIPGRRNDAIRHYEEALRIDPELGWAHLNLAALLTNTPGRELDAVAHYEETLRLIPGSAEAHYSLAIALWKIPGRDADVIANYREATRLRPDFADAHYNLALALVRQPDAHAEAAAHFESALRSRPDWPEAHYGYAILLSGLSRLPEAIAHYEEALRLGPDSPLVHYKLAEALYHSGRVADSISHLEVALQIDPNFEDARRRLAALRQQSRD